MMKSPKKINLKSLLDFKFSGLKQGKVNKSFKYLHFKVVTLLLLFCYASQGQVSITFDGKVTVLNSTTITSNTSINVNDVLTITDVATYSGQSIDAILTVNNIGSGAMYNPSTAKLELVPYNASTDDFIEMNIEFVNTGTSEKVILSDFTFNVTDIDSDAGFDVGEVVGYSDADNITFGSNLESGGFEAGGSPSAGVVTYRVRRDLNGSAADWTDEENVAESNTAHHITATFNYFKNTNLVFGSTGTNGSSSFARGVFLDGLAFQTIALDSDGDEIADAIDYDDDNDGILDIDEGFVDCPSTTSTGFDPELLQGAYHATLIKTSDNWIIAGQGLDGSGGDLTTFDFMSDVYTYPSGAIPYKVTIGGISTIVVLFSNGEFYTAGEFSNATIGHVLPNTLRPSGASWGLSPLTLPSGVGVSDVKTMRASGRMLMIITYSGEIYVVGVAVDSELDGTFSTTSFNQVSMPVGISVEDAHITQNSLFILGSDDNFYRYGTTTFDGDGTTASAVTGTADLMTQPTVSGDIVQFEPGINGSYLVLDGAGEIHVMGENTYGQLGLGNTTDQLSWTKISSLTGVKFISGGRRSNLWGTSTGYASGYIGSDDKVYLFGSNDANVITNAASNPQTSPVLASGVNADAISLVMGGHITPYLNSSYEIMNTGHNAGGGFGDGTTTDRSSYSGSSIATILGVSVTIGCSPIEIDTDSDGIADHLDTDSDDDGCSDAEEGAGSFTYSNGNIQNRILIGGVDLNGVPSVATSTGQGVGDAQDNTTLSCDCPYASGIDTDIDGVDNVCDLDDDNDGILDTAERCAGSSPPSRSVWWPGNGGLPDPYDPMITSALIASAEELVIGSGITATVGGQIDITAGVENNVFEDAFADNDYIQYEFATSSTRTAIHFLDYYHNSSIPEYPFTVIISEDDFSTYDILLKDVVYTYNSPATSVSGVTYGYNTNPVVLDTSTVYKVRAYMYNAPVGTITFDNFSLRLCEDDVDEDGIANILDNDSDGDGCSDAEEGVGSFTYLNGAILNDTLVGGVDSDGIPVAATNSGQGVGDAQDNTTLSCDCPYASGVDSDGDGIDNVCDLDDDNDGILDDVECTQIITPSYVSTTAIAEASTTYDDVTTTSNGIINLLNGASYDGFVFDTRTGTGQPNPEFNYTLTVPSDVIVNKFEMYATVGGATNEQVTAYDLEIYDNGNTLIFSGSASTGSTLANGTSLNISGFELNSGSYSLKVTDKTAEFSHREFSEVQFIGCQDTDSDGITNNIDTDSDDDGCSDAEEGSGSFSYSNGGIMNDTLVGGFDANGVPTAATSSGQGLGDAQDNTTLSCDCPYASGVDTDGDGVDNVCDLDDDNDGILDGEDNDCPSTGSIGQSAENYTRVHATNLRDGGFTLAFQGTNFNPDFSVTAQDMDADNTDGVWSPSSPYNEGYRMTTGNDITYVFSKQVTVQVDFQYTTDGGAEVYGLEVDGTEVINGADGDQIVTYTGETFKVFVTSGAIGYYVNVDLNSAICTPIDTDNDGIVNSLDTDSDNDGCTDAEEGTGSFSYLNGSIMNDTLVGGVDTDGIPVAATSSGQGVGDAQDINTSSCDCQYASGVDTDGDGVDDLCDLDDDNDGVLDSDECSGTASNWSILSNEGSSNSMANVGQLTNGSLTANVSITSTEATLGASITDALATFQEDISQTITITTDAPLVGVELFFQHIYTSAGVTTYLGDFEVELWDGTVISNVVFESISGDNGFPLIPNSTETPFSITTINGAQYAYDDTDNGAPDQHYGILKLNSSELTKGIKKVTFTVIGGPGGSCGLGLKALVVPDTDGDLIVDCLDLDSDNDGVPDLVEASGVDTDGDGKIDENIDSDGDGVPDYADPDDVSCTLGDVSAPIDGICDNVQGGTDTDGDGIQDTDDLDADGDGLLDTYDSDSGGDDIANQDSDGDGIADAYDLDSDNDGIPDIVEAGGTDVNGDGIADSFVDADGDGFNDVLDGDVGNDGAENTANALIVTGADTDADGDPDSFVSGDTDGDGLLDQMDLDADNDGIPDVVESGGTDTDGNGIADSFADADNDGFNDTVDGDPDNSLSAGDDSVDTNTSNALVLTGADSDGDGAPNSYPNDDTDGDGNLDHLDLDADNDGIPDLVEVGGIDTDGDGQVDTSTDIDQDGLADIYDEDATDGPGPDGTNGVALVETNGSGTMVAGDSGTDFLDRDGDNLPDHLDLDADNDGIPDLIEAGGNDPDGDGRVDTGLAPWDTDGDGLADSYDTDDNSVAGTNDGGDALIQTSADTNGDGTVDAAGEMMVTGGGGDLPINPDGDAVPNHLDIDADNDGIMDVTEAGATDSNNDGMVDDGSGSFIDTDGDGFADGVDGDVGNDGSFESSNPLITTGTDDSGDTDSRLEYGGNGTSDSDSDDVPDFLDVDSDNDGIYDNYEAQSTAGYIPPGTVDSDGDGLLDAYDADESGVSENGIDPYDHDTDSTPDYLDLDADDDNIPDMQEAWDNMADGDSQSDNVSSCTNVDSDGDGLIDCFDSDDGDASVYTWAGDPADDTDGATQGTVFTNSLDDILPDNVGNNPLEPDFRDDLNVCATAQVYYGITEASAGTSTDFEYNSSTSLHEDGAATNAVRATTYCEPDADGWYYYYNPLEPENYLFAIKNSAGSPNVIPMWDIVDYIEIKKDDDQENRSQVGSTDATHAMTRDWNVVFKGTPTVGSTFDVKFYFLASEMTALDAAADVVEAAAQAGGGSYTRTFEWMKKSGGLTNSDISTTGITGKEDITSNDGDDINESNTGNTDGTVVSVGNGKNYVQFTGLTSFSGGTAAIFQTFSVLLPVDLSSFKAKANDCSIDLTWETESEKDFDYFDLEWSGNGQDFRSIEIIEAIGGEFTEVYQFEDRQASSFNYYRLKMVDLDGSYKYSKIIQASTDCEDTHEIVIFPNPVSPSNGILNVKFYSERPEAELQITDMLGRVVKRLSLDVEPDFINTVQLDILDLPVGNYTLQLAGNKTAKILIIQE